MASRHPALQRLVACRLLVVGAQEVSDGDVAKLMLASGLADVQVKRARTLGRPGEEVEVR